MKTRVTVEGLEELDNALGQLTASAGKGVLRRVGRKALQPFDQAWRVKAPLDEDRDEAGLRLRDSGGVGSKLSRTQRRAHERESLVEVFAGPGPHPKAMQQEFGNVNHPAQPYLRPAWDETQSQVLDIVKTDLGDEIQKSAERLAKRTARLAKKAAGG